MRKFALALAAAAAFGLAAPAFAVEAAAPAKTAQTTTTKVVKTGGPIVKAKVTKTKKSMRHSSRHHGMKAFARARCKTVVVKSRHHGKIVIKKSRRCR